MTKNIYAYKYEMRFAIASRLFAPFCVVTVRCSSSNSHKRRPISMDQAKQTIQQLIDKNDIIIFTKSTCPYCHDALDLLNKHGVKYEEFVFDRQEDGTVLRNALNVLFKVSTVPQTFVRGERLGGYDNLCELEKRGVLATKLGRA